jgi:hypothetical protein
MRSLCVAIAFTLFALTTGVAKATESTSPQTAISSDPDALLKLAKKAGFTDLTDCETKLLRSAQSGESADCRSDDPRQNDPWKGNQWPKSRGIRAKLIPWLCVNDGARTLIDREGINIIGGKIPELDLEFVSVPFPIRITRSRFLSDLRLMEDSLGALNLDDTWTRNIRAQSFKTSGSVLLRDGFHSDGEVNLINATVGGDLDASRGTFNSLNRAALNAAGST